MKRLVVGILVSLSALVSTAQADPICGKIDQLENAQLTYHHLKIRLVGQSEPFYVRMIGDYSVIDAIVQSAFAADKELCITEIGRTSEYGGPHGSHVNLLLVRKVSVRR